MKKGTVAKSVESKQEKLERADDYAARVAEDKARGRKHGDTLKGTVKSLIEQCVKRGTVRPDVKVDVKKCLTLAEASAFVKVNQGRVGWMTRASGGNRLVAVKVDGKLMITKASLIAYKTHRDAYYKRGAK